MKAKDVIVGETYLVKVSGRVVPVQLLRESPHGGWEGQNTVTGRSVRVKTARKLRCKWSAVKTVLTHPGDKDVQLEEIGKENEKLNQFAQQFMP